MQGGADPAARRPLARRRRPGTPNLARSNGFEGMALSERRPHALPGARRPRRRRRSARAPRLRVRPRPQALPRGWREYRVARPDLLVADFTLRDGERFVALERDNAEGLAARHKQAFEVTLTPRRAAAEAAASPTCSTCATRPGISLPGRPGDIGLGDPFSMPYQTIESVLPLGEDRLAIVNDTNFGSRGRNPDQPDYSDFIVISTPRPSRDARTLAIIGDTPYGDQQEAAFPRLVAAVNDDPDVETVVHLGDIKNGSSTCDDARFIRLRALYDTFEDPFLYTPGDNEWTDCHRPAAGGYVPTERLARIRSCSTPRPRSPWSPSARRSSRTSAGQTPM